MADEVQYHESGAAETSQTCGQTKMSQLRGEGAQLQDDEQASGSRSEEKV